MPQVIFQVKLPAKITKRKQWYLACCPVLDVSSQGETREQAQANLVEALSLFLLSCYERGTLEAVLKECGFKPDYSGQRQPVGAASMLDVPLPFMLPSPG